ncbi:MAG: helix-turn-helix domain-containing protein [Terriglobia bacterium]
MSINSRIIQARNQKGISQEELGRRAGLAGSYISRIENRKIDPRPTTLRKIADALGIPLAELFREGTPTAPLPQCVITSSGNCIMDLLKNRSRRGVLPGTEHYSPRQLQLLRMANYLIQSSDTRLLETLDVLLSSLLASSGAKRADEGSRAS